MADQFSNQPRDPFIRPGQPDSRLDGRGWLQRLVMLEPGETSAFLWSAAYFFFVLFSYYLLRPVRDTIGIRGDIDRLPWLWTGTTIATLAVTPEFAWVVSRWPRRIFVPWLYRFFAMNLLGFWLLLTFLPAGPKNLAAGYAFFIWLSVFNLLSTSVFWGFMADAFSQSQGKRLFGPIGVGGTLGAILGGLVPATMADVLGPVNVILLSVVALEVVAQCVRRLCTQFGFGKKPDEPPTLLCPNCGYNVTGLPASDGRRRCPECGVNDIPRSGPRPSREPDRNVWTGFALIAKSPYLQMMVAYMLLYTITSTFLYIEQLTVVQREVINETTRTKLFAWIDVIVNVLTLLTQLFLTGRILTRLGVLAGLLLLPVLTLMGFAMLWRWELLGLLLGFQVLRRAMHYAVDRPTREVLYTVLGADAKYKSKAFIDTFVYRAGDLVGAWSKALADKNAVAVGLLGVVAAGMWCLTGAVLGGMQKRIASRNTAKESDVTAAAIAVHSASASAAR
jgi:ATP:ADP antiporter, AAA family